MNPKERVYTALRKEPVDRIPVFMWFHPDTLRRLAELLEIPSQFVDEAELSGLLRIGRALTDDRMTPGGFQRLPEPKRPL